jgi:peptide-methionine (S)-S-oxide reductase
MIRFQETLKMIRNISLLLAALLAIAFFALGMPSKSSAVDPAPSASGLEKATFAGGCFWCMETPFYNVKGVASVTSGYTGGQTPNPTYEQVSDGGTGHAEAVQVVFDPGVISYQQLLDIFWVNVDPTVADQQFCDRGNQYRSAIFTHTPEQAAAAEKSKAKWQADPRFAGKTIYTQLNPAATFYAAEEYHQGYALKNPSRYKYYRWNCGRDKRLAEIWGALAEKH